MSTPKHSSNWTGVKSDKMHFGSHHIQSRGGLGGQSRFSYNRQANLGTQGREYSIISIFCVLIDNRNNNLNFSFFQLVDQYVPSTILPVEYYCLIILVPIILLCQIKYLKFLAIFSGIANILLFTVYVVCLYYIFGGELSFQGKHAAGDPARYPAFLS